MLLGKAFTLKGRIYVRSKQGLVIISAIGKPQRRYGAAVRYPAYSRLHRSKYGQGSESLDSVRAKLITGAIGAGAEAVSKYSNDDEHKFTAGRILGKDGSGYLTIDQLDKDLVLMLKSLKTGQYSQPTEFRDERGRKRRSHCLFKSEVGTTPRKPER